MTSQRFCKVLCLRAFVLLTITLASMASYSIQPTPQQINLFKSMPPAQQAQMAQQFGVSLPSPTSQSTNQASANIDSVESRSSESAGVDESKVADEVSDSEEPEVTEKGDESGNKANKGLKYFGYDLFAGKPTTFTPITDIPVSSDYILGAGDSLKVNMYGKETQFFELEIDREGMVYMPDLGPLSLAGLSFSEAKQQLVKTVDQKMIGVKASVSMGRLRSIRVFVLGEAHQPGSYVMSSLSTITNALVLSGGVSTSGSLRNVQLKRRGKLIQTFDLYDLLLSGDTSMDAQLNSGDVVFIPPVGFTVGIRGEVRRPAIYEIKPNATAKQLISMAGGMLSTAHPKLTKVQRIISDDQKLLLDVDLAQSNSSFQLKNGDDVYIPPSLGILNDVVTISGEVLRSGMQHWQLGMRISDMVDAAGLSANADLNYALIKRLSPEGLIEVLSFSLSDVLANIGSIKDIQLQQLDEVIVFSWSGEKRQSQLQKIVAQLQAQTKPGEFTRQLSVEGAVRFSGVYPLTQDMRLSDALLLGGIESETDSNYALLIRRMENQKWDVQTFQPLHIINNVADSKNIKLQEMDRLVLFSRLKNDRQAQVDSIVDSLKVRADIKTPSKEVSITGDVRFPGQYPLSNNMTTEDLIFAAGGLTEKAFQLRAELSRTEFDAKQERNQYRVVLNLSENDSLKFSLKSRDELQIKTIPDWVVSEQVTLNGEVRFPGTYPIYKNDTLAGLLERAGGLTKYAYAPGAVFTREELKEQQAKQLKDMQDRLAEDIAKAELVTMNQESKGSNSTDVAEAQKLLSQLKNTSATGRLVIDLVKVLANDSDYSIPLQKGDKLYVPAKKNSVTVVGEVQLPISQIYEAQLDYRDYIERSGGTTDKADEGRVYIIKANGGVQIPNNSSWFASSQQQIAPGDTIVVPLDADKLDQVVLWRDVSQVFYQIALGAAAVGSL